MTNLEALKSIIGGNYPFDNNMYSKALIDQGISETDTYSILNIKPIDLAYAGLIQTLIVSPDIGEGSYKLTVADRADLIKIRTAILNKYGLSESTGFVKDRSDIW